MLSLTKSRCALLLAALASLSSTALADVYMHFPRGQNDRCDEKSNDRNNGNRLFDSENNAAGGYATENGGLDSLTFYEDTDLRIEWTLQHSCGNAQDNKNDPDNPENTKCNVVLQAMCEDTVGVVQNVNTWAVDSFQGAYASFYNFTDGMPLGTPDNSENTCTQTIPEHLPKLCTEATNQDYSSCQNLLNQINSAKDGRNSCNDTVGNAGADAVSSLAGNNIGNSPTEQLKTCTCFRPHVSRYAQHEPYIYYQKCKTRDRNAGLFYPNGGQGQSAVITRQQNNQDRFGYECAEERDYYPYWHPSPFKDIAVLVSDLKMCPLYTSNSQNVQPRGECVNQNNATDSAAWKFNNEPQCTSGGFQWVSRPSWGSAPPACERAQFSTDNRLGNIAVVGTMDSALKNGQLAHYVWRIPKGFVPEGVESMKCSIRIRYNMTSAEVLEAFDKSTHETATKKTGGFSTNPLITMNKDNPVVIAGVNSTDPTVALPLRIALQRNQNGRTFEDRSYIFNVKKRVGAEVSSCGTIHNLNVRGKRGNIAQVRNCVEYDFIPASLDVMVGDCIHVQWTGSDYNPQNNAGQGRAGSDRSNLVNTNTPTDSFPSPICYNPDSYNNGTSQCIFSADDMKLLAWTRQNNERCYSVADMTGAQATNQQSYQSCHFMNCNLHQGRVSPYFGAMVQVKNPGVFYFMSTRNNNFSNRSQKSVITSIPNPATSAGAIAGYTIAGLVVVGLGASAFILHRKQRLMPLLKRGAK